MSGFFSASGGRVSLTVPRCDLCGLCKTCLSPKMPTSGDGGKEVLIVAEAPGKTEDERGVQLVGKAGGRLRRMLQDLGCNLDADCWKTNAVICRPPGNETPTDRQIEYCRPNLVKTIRQYQPRVIVLLGGVAMKSLIGISWDKDLGSVGRWVGWQIPSYRWGSWICPTYHPSYLEREKGSDAEKVLDLWTREHLKAALALSRLEGQQSIGHEVCIVDRPADVVRKLKQYADDGGAIAFDYETNMLKPDGSDAEIVSCAVCWRGRETIAYAWVGEAIAATGELLRSPVPKIAANLKFEERWTRKAFGFGVRNWVWDTMQAAHVLDNRQGITGLKFQAFVRLGVEPYDREVAPFFSGGGTRKPNRIREVPVQKLLLYNGMDAAAEYKLASLQRRELSDEY